MFVDPELDVYSRNLGQALPKVVRVLDQEHPTARPALHYVGTGADHVVREVLAPTPGDLGRNRGRKGKGEHVLECKIRRVQPELNSVRPEDVDTADMGSLPTPEFRRAAERREEGALVHRTGESLRQRAFDRVPEVVRCDHPVHRRSETDSAPKLKGVDTTTVRHARQARRQVGNQNGALSSGSRLVTEKRVKDRVLARPGEGIVA